jgi:SAM-dependent methyltransferase
VTVTADDVIWCYRLILGRQPESPDAIKAHASSASDFRALVERLINSKEYRQRRPSVLKDRVPIEVEVAATAKQLSSLKDSVRQTWSHLGRARPYFSVLTNQRYLPDSISAQAIERFYASGAREVQATMAILARHGFRSPEAKVCLEYGCGLGRVTLALAKVFKQVHAYDISDNHLALAKKRALELGINNIEFHLCSAQRVVDELANCDFYYSRLVFQHNPPPIIRSLICEALNSLRSGGIAIFQVPTYMPKYQFRIDDYLGKQRPLQMEMHCLPQQHVFSQITDARCQLLEVLEDVKGAGRNAWVDDTFVAFRRTTANRTRARRSRGSD